MLCIATASMGFFTVNTTNSTLETVCEIVAIFAIGSGLAIMLGAWFADLPILDFLFV
jgi:hypothetical protein